MGVFHVFYIVQMIPNRATHHISIQLTLSLATCSRTGGEKLQKVKEKL